MSQIKRMLHEYTLEIAVALLCIGLVLTVIGFSGLLKEHVPSVLRNMVESIGAWYLWLVIVGPVLCGFGFYYLYDGIRKRKEFDELVNTTSKAKFVKSLDRIEELAWYLTIKHKARVAEKKREFKIKN